MKQSYTPLSFINKNANNDSDYLEWQVEHSCNDILSLLYLLRFNVRKEVTDKLFKKIEKSDFLLNE